MTGLSDSVYCRQKRRKLVVLNTQIPHTSCSRTHRRGELLNPSIFWHHVYSQRYLTHSIAHIFVFISLFKFVIKKDPFSPPEGSTPKEPTHPYLKSPSPRTHLNCNLTYSAVSCPCCKRTIFKDELYR